MGMPAGQETRQHHPCRSWFWSRAAEHRLAQTVHARVPPPAQKLRTTSLLSTVEHEHACWPGDTPAPSLQILILEKSSSAVLLRRCTPGSPHLRCRCAPQVSSGQWSMGMSAGQETRQHHLCRS